VCQPCARFSGGSFVWLVRRDKSWGGGRAGGWCASSSVATARAAAGGTSAAPCTAPSGRPSPTLNKVLRDRDLGRRVEGATVTFDEFLDRWLNTAAKPKLRDKSYESYESLLRRYIRPVLGGRILSAVTPLDVHEAYQKMIDRGLSSRTVRYTHSVLRSAMRQAIRWRLLLQDPTDGAQLPRLGRREIRVLAAQQSRIFLSAALKTHYGPVFAVALTTGMRPSEYLALKWQDIDWDRGTVSVVRTLERSAGGWRFAETKRARSGPVSAADRALQLF